VPKKYPSEKHVYCLDVGYTRDYGISLMLDDIPENHGTHEVITMSSFTPAAFSNNPAFVRGVTVAVTPAFSK
jgi:hypothetical protein